MLLLDISNEYRHGERERMAERNKLLHPIYNYGCHRGVL